MKLIKDRFSGHRQINGFSKDKVLELKSEVKKLPSEEEEMDVEQFLKDLFPTEIIEVYSDYVLNIKDFIPSYVIQEDPSAISEVHSFFHLKLALMEELDLISQNLLNLKRNVQNIQRFLRNNEYLRKYLSDVTDLMELIEECVSPLKTNTGEELIPYRSASYLWSQTVKIKNPTYTLMSLPGSLNQWEEFSSLFSEMESKGTIKEKKGIINKEASEIELTFNQLSGFCSNAEDIPPEVCSDLLYLLYSQELLVEESPTESLSEQEREKSKEKIKDLLQSIIRTAILKILEDEIETIRTFEKEKGSILLNEESKPLNKIMRSHKISDLLPDLINSYISYLELDYRNKLDISQYEDLKKIEDFEEEYSVKCEALYDKIEGLTMLVNSYKRFIYPFEYVIDIYEQVFSSVLSEIVRRKDELIYYLKTVRNEWIKEDLRAYIDKQIEELDGVIARYRDEMAQSLKDEFPQIKYMEEILNKSQEKMQRVKSRVSEKLKKYRGKEVKQYQFIKKWEDTFARRRQQIQFLLVQYFTKLVKEFGDILEKENEFYRSLEDIKGKAEDPQELPLNYLLSSYITEKLTEKELRERISNIKGKIKELQVLEERYKSELTNLEETLTKKVKKIKDITTETVQCGVCHEHIDLTTDKIIKCPFCGAVYHYLCIAFWLQEYNSCPSCQNVFMDPGSNIYEPG